MGILKACVLFHPWDEVSGNDRDEDRHYSKRPGSILPIGGDLHRHGPDLVENCRKFVELVRKNFLLTLA